MAVKWRMGVAGAFIALCAAADARDTGAEPEAYRVMLEFWDLVESNRFGETRELFADDIVFIDPIWGRYEGREAAGRFMQFFDGVVDGCCTLDRLVADERTGWGMWTQQGPDGPESWVGVYEVKGGKIVYYRDFHERVYSPEEQAALTAAVRASAEQ
ncbi:MAG: nuclear transport factor 2 family protein [Gammaproteobacteria bacterium]|nr:nuclear transport factor 2 family protein [Gammaproteobacteria bacterium]